MVNNDAANKSIDDTDKKAQGTSKTFGGMIGSAAKMGAGIALAVGAAAVAVGGLAVSFSEDLQKSLNGVQASTGITDEAMVGMKDTMVAIYNNNFGENFEEIGAAMTLINQQTGLAGEALQGVTENALALKDTFGMEVETSILGANQLMKQFGLTGEESYNLIAQGAQWGLDANGDLLDTLREYSGTFADQGFSATEMFNMLSNATNAGIRDTDLAADAIKEFGIRSKDGSKASAEGFKALGLNSTEMTKSFAKGGDTAKAAFDKTTKALFAMKDPVAQNAAGVALFGTQWEDLGIEGVKALTNTQGEISKTVDALGKINEVKYATFGEAIEGIKRNFQTGLLLPLGEQIMPKLNQFAKWISTNMPAIQNEISYAMTVVSGAFKLVSDYINTVLMPVFSGIWAWIQPYMPQIKQFVTDAFTGIKNAVMMAYDYLKPHFDNLVNVMKTSLIPIIMGLWDTVQRAMPGIKAVFEIVMPLVVFAVGLVIDIVAVLIKVVKGIYDFIKPPLDLVAELFSLVFGGIKLVIEGVQWVLDKFNGTPIKDKESKVTVTQVTNYKSGQMLSSHEPAFANGTDFAPGGEARVNELGGEIIDLPRGSRVIPHDVSMEMARNSATSSSKQKSQPTIIQLVLQNGKAIAEFIVDDLDELMGDKNQVAGRAVGV